MIVYFTPNVTTSEKTAKRIAFSWEEKDRKYQTSSVFNDSVPKYWPCRDRCGSYILLFFFLLEHEQTALTPASANVCKLHELGILERDLLVLYQCWPNCTLIDTIRTILPCFLDCHLCGTYSFVEKILSCRMWVSLPLCWLRRTANWSKNTWGAFPLCFP